MSSPKTKGSSSVTYSTSTFSTKFSSTNSIQLPSSIDSVLKVITNLRKSLGILMKNNNVFGDELKLFL